MMKRMKPGKKIVFLFVISLLVLQFSSNVRAQEAQQEPNTLRVHYQNPENGYDDLGIWFWGDVESPSEKSGPWPAGRSLFSQDNLDDDQVFLDIKLIPDAKQVGMLVIDGSGNKLTFEDLMIDILAPNMKEVWINNQREVSYEDLSKISEDQVRIRFLRESGEYGDMGVWFWGDAVTPSEKNGAWPLGATPLTLANDNLKSAYADIEIIPEAKELGLLFVNRASGEQTPDYALSLSPGIKVYYIHEGEDTFYLDPYRTGTAEEEPEEAILSTWETIDAQYKTDSTLGAELLPDGRANLKLWAPTADLIEVVLYDKMDPLKVVKDGIPMALNADHVWELTLDEANSGFKDLDGAFYHYRVIRGNSRKLVLDPYAKSMAAWDNENTQGELVGKAAIVNPAALGPELDYAKIEGFIDREDAIIYEAHVRDFTSDPSIEQELQAPYGTFAAFGERLDYLKRLGVTHIQLMPVLSYYYVNEHDRARSPQYASKDENYNWGYDPQSYFSLSGMYSTNPDDPGKRIEEFKALVELIHKNDMGVILDVVYNHTARIELLEDIEPNYYYFMDNTGKPKGSYGGGQVGSTHLMTRKLIIDSLVYLSDTYKVDGYRFDLMGNLDSQTIEQAFDMVSQLNPNTLWIGEGWKTFSGDAGVGGITPADQAWMDQTDAVAVFSDEVRNELKSGFGNEGQPRFITGGKRLLTLLFSNVIARPGNISEDDPGDVVQYIAAHDNLTLHDVIAYSIKKDPKDHEAEILQRQKLGNALILTHQGIIFLHSGQEYGRTKQFRDSDYIGKVDSPPANSTYFADEKNNPFEYPYFIHDNYDASDAVNQFDWEKAEQSKLHKALVDYTRGLIAIRRSTDAFSYAQAEEIDHQISQIFSPSIEETDLVIAYSAKSIKTGDEYLVIVNADGQERSIDLSSLQLDIKDIDILADRDHAGIDAISDPVGIKLESVKIVDENQLKAVTLESLTATIIKVKAR